VLRKVPDAAEKDEEEEMEGDDVKGSSVVCGGCCCCNRKVLEARIKGIDPLGCMYSGDTRDEAEPHPPPGTGSRGEEEERRRWDVACCLDGEKATRFIFFSAVDSFGTATPLLNEAPPE
jgi:hypothetical protein